MIARLAGWLFVPLFGYLFVWCIRAIPKAREIQKENAKRIDAAHTRDYQKLGGSWETVISLDLFRFNLSS